LPPVLPPLTEQKGDLFFLSPSLELGFRHAVDLQVGTQVDLHGGNDTTYGKLLPFVSLGVDVLGFGEVPRRASLKVFGSYAERTQVFVDDYSLMDLAGGGGAYSLADVHRPKYTYEFLSTSGGGTTDTIINQMVPVRYPNRFRVYQAGIAFALGKVFRVSYSYERKDYLMPGNLFAFLSGNASQSVAIVPVFKSDLHHLDIRVQVTGEKALVWETGLGVTALRSRQYYTIPFGAIQGGIFAQQTANPTGDLYPTKLSWTGGFVNRLSAGGFEAGLDVLYHFGEPTQSNNGYFNSFDGPKLNSVLVPNIYAGYRWKLSHARVLELFVESRGLARSKSSDLPDDRRYYTVGAQLRL
jgi:hypothetical protein